MRPRDDDSDAGEDDEGGPSEGDSEDEDDDDDDDNTTSLSINDSPTSTLVFSTITRTYETIVAWNRVHEGDAMLSQNHVFFHFFVHSRCYHHGSNIGSSWFSAVKSTCGCRLRMGAEACSLQVVVTCNKQGSTQWPSWLGLNIPLAAYSCLSIRASILCPAIILHVNVQLPLDVLLL